MADRKRLKYALNLILNPNSILDNTNKYKWYLFLLYPASGWSLFFLQVYLSSDINSPSTLIKMLVSSFVLGYAVNFVIGLSLTFLLKLIKRRIQYDNVITLISLSHTYMFFSLVLGFLYRLIDPSASVAFGVAGLLCTLLPIYAGIRNLGSKNPFVPPLLATYVGVLMMFCWKLIMVIGD